MSMSAKKTWGENGMAPSNPEVQKSGQHDQRRDHQGNPEDPTLYKV